MPLLVLKSMIRLIGKIKCRYYIFIIYYFITNYIMSFNRVHNELLCSSISNSSVVRNIIE